MAKQTGIIKLVGKIGNIVYYFDKIHGYLARKVTSVNAERIRTDPAFERVRENNTEFGLSSWTVKLLRAALKPLFATVADTRMTSRLTRAIIAVIKSDTTNAPGARTTEHGRLNLLQGFQFNKDATLQSTLRTPYTTALDRTSGTYSITTPHFRPKTMLHAPKGATHFRLTCGAAEINFETGKYVLHTINTQEIPVKDTAIQSYTLAGNLTPDGTDNVFIALGVEFLQQVNGKLCPLNDRNHNALALVQVEKVLAPDAENATIYSITHTNPIRRAPVNSSTYNRPPSLTNRKSVIRKNSPVAISTEGTYTRTPFASADWKP
jgi:hypothetical protein